MNLELQDKIALVGGASRGIGLGIATSLLNEGCKVILVARDAATLDATVATLGKHAIAMTADLSCADDCARLADAVRDRFGGLDLLVTNVGSGVGAYAGDQSPERRAPDRRHATRDGGARGQRDCLYFINLWS